jgi:two-component system NtrC family sensor kinase
MPNRKNNAYSEEPPTKLESRPPIDESRENDDLADDIVALKSRPALSIRARIIFSFLLFFLMCVALNVWSIWVLSKLEHKIEFLEIAASYMNEIQQARRFEKNYLLYETNLEDALVHLTEAERILHDNSETIENIVTKHAYETMAEQVADYHKLLEQLGTTGRTEVKTIEPALREYGGKMVSFAQEFERKEKASVNLMLRRAKQVPFVFLVILMLIMLFIALFLTRQLLFTFGRFMAYTKRIGEGDFSPITPVRKYKDEFTELAAAFNRMIRELDHREKVLVESHKLRAIGTLVAGVAHELNNPLNNTMLTAALLKEDFKELPDEEKLEMIDDVIHETERSREIVKNLLDFSRKSETQIKPIELNRIVENSVLLVANQIRIAKVKLTTDYTEDLPIIHGDEQRLKQVFVNLMLNALAVLPPKGSLIVSTYPSGEAGFVAVDIQDNGPGIPEHILPRIFDPFFTTKPKGKGTGLGLSVSRGIIRKLGGEIHVASKVGLGTKFTVLLPVTDQPSDLHT